ncbi:MAG: hypothetical protein WEC73_02155, partial [Chthoniobacterales bacterium]
MKREWRKGQALTSLRRVTRKSFASRASAAQRPANSGMIQVSVERTEVGAGAEVGAHQVVGA